MKKKFDFLTAVALTAAVAAGCSNPFFGEQLKSAHIEEGGYEPPQYTKILPPLTVTATDTEIDQIIVEWSSVAGASAYRVYRSDEEDSGYTLLTEAREASFTDTGSVEPLKSGFTYYYKISTVNSESIESDLSQAVLGRCYLSAGGIIPPVEVTASQGAYFDKIEISWTPVPTAQSYRIFRAKTDEPQIFESEDAVVGSVSDISSWIDEDVVFGEIYYYKIQSIGTAPAPEAEPEMSVLSESAAGYLADKALPSVSGLKVSDGFQDRIELTWDAVDFPVRIFRAEGDPSANYTFVADVPIGTNSYAEYKSSGVIKEKKYFYKIQAVKSESEKGILSDAVEGHVVIEKPVITLVGGNETMIIDLNRVSSFTDPGFRATDNFDGDLTDYVESDYLEAINWLVRGEQEITYTVTDAAGNTATAVRKIKTVFLPNADAAEIKLVSKYAAAGQPTTVELTGLQPPEADESLSEGEETLMQTLGLSYYYEWTVNSGTVEGNGARVSLAVDFEGTEIIEERITVNIAAVLKDENGGLIHDGFVEVSKSQPFYPSLESFGSGFDTAGQFAPFTADVKTLWKMFAAGWVIKEEAVSGLTGDYDYSYAGGAHASSKNTENIVKCAEGAFVMSDTSAYFEYLGCGDAAETAVRLNGPVFDVVGGVTYKVVARIYRAAGSKADVFVTVGSEEFLAPVTEGWHDIAFDYTPAADSQTSLKVWKMPAGVRDWDGITEGEDGNLKTGSDMKEVKVDSISIRYADGDSSET